VGENPLNGSGALVEKQEDIVCSQMKICGIILIQQGVTSLKIILLICK
jgi:hypothetical protein